jgi:8-oxo-dGTP pyrophosphatase MutT (NUDIX family)
MEVSMESASRKSELFWEFVDSRADRDYALFGVRIHRNRSPRTGRIHEFQVLTSPDWVAVIPITPDGNMVLVRQYRHGSGDLSLEPPGGLVKPGSSPEQSAREELEEETGYRPGSMIMLGWMHPMPALFTNKFFVYLARDVTPTGRRHPDETEEVETVLASVEKVRSFVRTGHIRASVMIAALHLFFDHWDRRGGGSAQ